MIRMREIFRHILLSTTITILIAGGSSLLPTIYAQSSDVTQTGCPDGSIVGLSCVTKKVTHTLPMGKWSADVNGANGTLIISSVDKMGKIRGTLVGGNFTCAPLGKPCLIQGSFNERTGRISFTTHSSVPTFAAIVENYTGYESERLTFDFKVFQIHGIGKTIKPFPGHEFGWSAVKGCTVMGCIG
jgi:hypothetical protein